MAPLIALLVSFTLFLIGNKFLFKNRFKLSEVGRTAMALMLILTGVAHFTRTELMAEMVPGFIPWKETIVYVTGLLELAAAIGLLFSSTSRLTSTLLIVFFICLLPANIIGAIKQVPMGRMEAGPIYLLFRIPLQVFFIWWLYYFGIKLNGKQV